MNAEYYKEEGKPEVTKIEMGLIGLGSKQEQSFPEAEAEGEKQDASTLSGGEQQMCAFSRGIISRPRLLMIDEFSLGLAPQAVERLSEALIEINKTGITMLLVEQDVVTAFEVANYAFVIETGRVTLNGSTKELSDNPMIRQAYMGI